jgi:predicted DNA-binding WGR domain protein
MISRSLSDPVANVRAMRSFEFVEGSSAKFWEISRAGCAVTVRFGRIGTQGQSSVKTLADETAAAAHETKLINEKLRKGYAETTVPSTSAVTPVPASSGPASSGPAVSDPTASGQPISHSVAPATFDSASSGPAASDSAASSPTVSGPAASSPVASGPAASSPVASGSAVGELVDEDVLVLPQAWARSRTPRRGSAGVGKFTPSAKARAAAEAELARHSQRTVAVLEAPTTEEETRREGLAWLAGEPDATPLGAAAVVATADHGHWDSSDWANCFADMWIRERGPVFAAEAAVTMNELIVVDDDSLSAYAQRPGVRHRRPGERHPVRYPSAAIRLLLRVRQALAAAPDHTYAEVVDALRPYRARGSHARAAVAVLVPEERAWFEQDRDEAVAAGDDHLGTLLLLAAGTAEDVTALAPIAEQDALINSMNLLVTMIDGVGGAAAPMLFSWLDGSYNFADDQRRLLSVLAVLPGDEVTRGLIERIGTRYAKRALLENTERYPARALRLLAESAGDPAVTDLFRGHLLKHRDLASRVIPLLGVEATERVEQILAEADTVSAAPLSAVPPVLADPPWRHLPEPVKPLVIKGLTCGDPMTFSWLPGEREQWAALPFQRYDHDGRWDPEVRRQAVLGNQLPLRDACLFFLDTAEEITRPALAAWRPYDPWMAGTYMRLITARFGSDTLAALMSLAPHSPVDVAPALQPFATPAIAVLMADWLARLKGVGDDALAWLLRHPAEAARALIPPALGKPGPARRQAEGALLALHANGHSETVRAAARGYGDAAAAAVATLVDTDPAALDPSTIPSVPVWATPGVLQPILLRDGSGSLPGEAVENLFVLLALSPLDAPSPELAAVLEACEPSSLAAFAWSLFELWQTSGSVWKERWAFEALGHLGDDDTVRRLTPLILAWPGESGHNKSVIGLQVLASIGTDVALMHLHTIAQRSKFTGLKNAAVQKMDQIGATLGLTAEQLADRLVPDLGLDADGSLRLDYGPRQFVVGFDEHLQPYVAEPAGKRLKALPRPGARDDAALGPAAYQRFTTLKKDVRTVAADQVRRLEHAMVTNRRWSGAEFRRLFIDHPLLWHLVRRLVWARFDPPLPETVAGTPEMAVGAPEVAAGAPEVAAGAPEVAAGAPEVAAGAPEVAAGAPEVAAGAFRVAEDRTLSTVDDETTTVPDDAVIGVAHPLHLGEDLAAWAEVFADYEILQPFAQLGRPVFILTEAEARSSRLARFQGVKVPTGRLLSLERRGWRRETPKDAGHQGSISLVIEPGRELIVEFEPGFSIGYIDMSANQELTDIFLYAGSDNRWRRNDSDYKPFAELDRVTISELLHTLTELAPA